MQRIAVVGSAGSGKTWLSRRLGAALGLPVTHLDAVFYDADWTPATPTAFAAAQRDLVAGERWVVDGNYVSTLPIRLERADTVVFVDVPPVVCLWGMAQRRWRTGGGQHPDVGVYDRVSREVVRYVWRYRARMRPRVDALLAAHGDGLDVVRLTGRRAARRWLAQVACSAAA